MIKLNIESIADLVQRYAEQEPYKSISERLQDAEGQAVCGQAVGGSKSLLASLLASRMQKPVLIIAPEQSDAYNMLDDVNFFRGQQENAPPLFVFPHLEILPYESQVPELTIRMERLAPLQYKMESKSDSPPCVIIAPIAAALKRMPSLEVYETETLRCTVGGELDRELISMWLVEQGYEYRDLVAQRGDFSARGDIIDIYSFSYPNPVRIELWGDEVESIRLFNVSDQRSIETINEVVFYPANEETLLRAAIKKQNELPSLLSLFGEEAIVLFSDHDKLEEEGRQFEDLIWKRYREASGHSGQEELDLGHEDFHKHQQVLLEPPERLYFTYDQFEQNAEEGRLLRLTEFTLEPDPSHINLGCATPEIFGEDRQERINSLLRLSASGQKIYMICDNTGQQSRMDEILDSQAKELKLGSDVNLPQTHVGALHRGFTIHPLQAMLCTDREIFGRYQRFRTPVREGIAMPIHELLELKPGDYVVHIDHGIGKYIGLKRMEHEGRETEFLELEYADGGVLYVPIDQVDRVGRYVGGDTSEPTLSKLGNKSWERTKQRAKEAIEDMAEELLDLYATRQVRKGHAFSPDTHWQHDFEASFLYEETPDQWRAIEEVKRDMEADEPMDRLVCGDVGFGKTEIAIRAAFKAVLDGKQVAVLTPTTILCQQHFNTFSERFADYPIRVEMLSRFLTHAEQKKVVEAVNGGDVNIIVGTHRILSQDIKIDELGLVIVDEEQRFGVKHKERLRQMRKLVDTITLTATPIPRTLYMSLSGIRNMSLVSTPPKNRLPIETYIMEWSAEVIENAILRELSRDGQVYFVHNRVESIYQVAHRVQEIVPQARICVGHGQMSENELESVMMKFIGHEYDVLLATTIIENGLDISNVNTIIINRADHFGLSQLYQLRGRVGRDRHRAYCYLLVQSKQSLTPVARRRLLALQEHNQLGSGFQLAMRDMELRGIGNILGRQQHGHIAAIGFDLYSKLLNNTVTKIKGNKKIPIDWETSLEMAPKGAIPPNYVESSKQRMALHQRIAKIKTFDDIEALREELTDIYGTPPKEVERLLHGLKVRVRAYKAGMDIVQVFKNRAMLRYHLSQSDRFDPLKVLSLDGQNGLKFVLETKGDNIQIQINDQEKKGTLIDGIYGIIETLDSDEPVDVPPPKQQEEPKSLQQAPPKEEEKPKPKGKKVKSKKFRGKYGVK